MIHIGDCQDILPTMPEESVHTCVTSPPYFGLRDYGVDGQIGLEPTPAEFVQALVEVFREVRRVLRDDGTLWLNLGDSYANDGKWGGSSGGKHASALHGNTSIGRTKVRTGLKPKELIGIPWRVAFALQADGWYLRQDIIWHKPNPMPESVTDRCTKAHEYLFLLSKSPRYYYDAEAIKEPAKEWGGRAATFDRSGNPVADHIIPGQSAAQHRPRQSKKRGEFSGKTNALPGREAFRAITETRNKRSVWTVPTKPFSGAHFATFPAELIEPCVLPSWRRRARSVHWRWDHGSSSAKPWQELGRLRTQPGVRRDSQCAHRLGAAWPPTRGGRMTRTLNPEGLSRPEASAEERIRKRHRAALRKRGACAFCQFREETFGIVHCKGLPERQRGMCQNDRRFPQFRLDDETLKEFRNAT